MRLSRAPCEKQPQYEQRHEKMILQHDNARPHVAKPVKTYLETLKWEVLPHRPYSPDTAPSNYYLLRSMAHGLADQQFRSYEDIEKWFDSWIASKDEQFYNNGIRALPKRWAKVVAYDGQYFEWFICNHFFTIKLHFHQKNSGNLIAHLIQKNFMIQNCLLQEALQRIVTFFYKVYIFLFDLKKYYWKSKLQFFKQNMWGEISAEMHNFLLKWSLFQMKSFCEIFGRKSIILNM